jgi:CheY-like chemotaxis protein
MNFAITSAWRRESSARTRLVGDTGVLADVIGSNSTAAVAFGDAKAATDTLRALTVNESIVSAAIWAKGGDQLARFERRIVNQRVAVGLLKRRGHDVTVVENGREAVDAVEREQFDIVLMDLQMPAIGGLEATRAIRDRERETSRDHLRIVAMIAHAMSGDRERCLAAGMDGYLSKPTESRTLFAEVERDAFMSTAPPIDEIDLVSRLHGDKELATEIVRLFADECPTLLQDIRIALDKGDPAAVRRAAHTLKALPRRQPRSASPKPPRCSRCSQPRTTSMRSRAHGCASPQKPARFSRRESPSIVN